jgi:predicted nucleotidyltransferase
VRHGFDDIEVPVIEVSDLVALKILAARAKDIDDVVALLRIQARTIDQARVRHILRLLEDALGQSDLVPAFEAALRRARE